MSNFTYILRCADGTLYTGWTNDLDRRVAAHQSGRGGKYTRSRLPVALVYSERHDTKSEAMRREWEIKQLSREEKLKLIGDDNTGDDRSDRGRFSVWQQTENRP